MPLPANNILWSDPLLKLRLNKSNNTSGDIGIEFSRL